MAAMHHYVGTWTCTGCEIEQPSEKATVTFTLDSGLLREWIVLPPQGRMKNPYSISAAFSYDSKNDRFSQAGPHNVSESWVSYAKPWNGDTEEWTDHQNSAGKLGRSQIACTGHDTYLYPGIRVGRR
ncbi:MAG TPA: hypothetical protein VIX60_02495 [Candidatus Cybelea sp.]